MPHDKRPILAVLVFLERRKTRQLAGKLTYDSKKENFVFEYERKYLELKLIPLGPELPLSRKRFVSKKLFESFSDRIPPSENPAYPEYCAAEGISPQEKDPFVLLTTIARRGPSSFIFEALCEQTFLAADVKAFRNDLHLTTKEFAIAFAVSEKTLIAIEQGQRAGKEVMKRLELYIQFPDVALFEFRKNCARIHINKRRLVEQNLNRKMIERVL